MENPSYRASIISNNPEHDANGSNNNETNNENLTNANEGDLDCEQFDDILDIIGALGRFQKILLYAVVTPVTLIQPFVYLNAIFLLSQPDHWCHVPGRDNATSLETWKKLHIPLDVQSPVGPHESVAFSQCTMYGSNGSVVKCETGWDYDRSDYKSTIPTDFDWVCDKSNYPVISFTVQAFGTAFGTLVLGSLADKWGRKPVFFLAMFTIVGARLSSLFLAENHNLFLLMQFLVGTAFPVMFINPIMITAELSDKDYRGWVYSVTWIVWVIGMLFLPIIAWICSDWYIIGLMTTLPGIGTFFYWFTMPESPRWLFSVGRVEEAANILMDMAECNCTSNKLTKSQLVSTLQCLYAKQDKTNRSLGMWSLFSRFRLGKNTLLLTMCWSINIIVYYGITLHSTHMSGNQFLNFFILAAVEIPSGLIGAYLVDKVGRRWIQSFFFCFCAIACVATAIAVNYSKETLLEIVLVTIAKFAVTVTYLIVYLQGAEIFPTALRSTGSSFASTIGGALGMLGPPIVGLGAYHQSYPYWILSSLCFLGMMCAAFIPETLNQHLPETIEDANDFGKLNKFWSIYPNSKPKSEGIVLSDNPGRYRKSSFSSQSGIQ